MQMLFINQNLQLQFIIELQFVFAISRTINTLMLQKHQKPDVSMVFLNGNSDKENGRVRCSKKRHSLQGSK